MNQLNHYNTSFKPQTFPVVLVSDNVNNPSNIGSLFRLSDAFGIEKLILCGSDINISRKALKTSRATEKIVNFEIQEQAIQVLTDLKNQSYQIISLEITKNSLPLHTFKFNQEEPIALVIGDENFGVSEDILSISDHIVHINMFGQNSSMNVAQATNIALYEITKQLI